MRSNDHILISLDERHAKNILSGTKRVELRRRTMHISSGTIVWLYVKQPVGSVVGCAVVAETHTLTPSQIWRRFGQCSGLKKSEFFTYVEGLETAFVLELKNVRKMQVPVGLGALRDASSRFHPPQFFSRIDAASGLARVMASGM